MEENYCASFAPAPWQPDRATCRQRVWIGTRPAAEAVQEACATCPLFQRPGVAHRLKGLSRFFRFLARIGVVETNFMKDVTAEHREDNPETDHAERRRNPTMDEERKLVNGTAHPQRRAFYAASAKWWARPNEYFMLDRYASLGLPTPDGLPKPAGFEEGHAKYPDLPSFAEGGDLVYIPDTKGPLDKRKGNRWLVIDAELRPILEQHLAWWEKTVRRDERGLPVTTQLWLTERGLPMQQRDMYGTLFHKDALRLGLVTEEELDDPRRVWTAHCQRHFGEQLCQVQHVPDVWAGHFRGDVLGSARKHYFKPQPQQVRQQYLELVPTLGFKPLPDAPRLRAGALPERAAHAAVLEAEKAKAATQRTVEARTVRLIVAEECIVVPRKLAGSFLFAAKHANQGASVRLEPDEPMPRGRQFRSDAYAALMERGLAWLA